MPTDSYYTRGIAWECEWEDSQPEWSQQWGEPSRGRESSPSFGL